jgi:hypothetical protein
VQQLQGDDDEQYLECPRDERLGGREADDDA